MKANATYSVNKWDEKPFENISSGSKMTKASIEFEFKGDMAGKASVDYLMFYSIYDEKDQHNSSAVYTGFMRFTGSVGSKNGSFVLQDNGTYKNGEAVSDLIIISGSGLDELKNISGSGKYIANKDGYRIELEYEI